LTAFWILAPVMVLAALGILVVRKAVHAALLLAVVMISLAVLYLVQNAPFLFAVQIIVYTGAILMLFLFVVMLVGSTPPTPWWRRSGASGCSRSWSGCSSA
jgi:NADH-quinone oxidoreductase subunit J